MCGQLRRYEAAADVFVVLEEDDEELESDELLLLCPLVEPESDLAEPDSDLVELDLLPFEDDFEDSDRESVR